MGVVEGDSLGVAETTLLGSTDGVWGGCDVGNDDGDSDIDGC